MGLLIYKKTTHTPRGERITDRAQNKGRTEQSQVQRHSAEEAGRDSSMGHWCRQRGHTPAPGQGEGGGMAGGKGAAGCD